MNRPTKGYGYEFGMANEVIEKLPDVIDIIRDGKHAGLLVELLGHPEVRELLLKGDNADEIANAIQRQNMNYLGWR